MISKQSVENLKAHREWSAFEKHVNHSIIVLDRVTNIMSASQEQLAVEALARIRAIDVLKSILEPFQFSLPQNAPKVQKAREKHGL